MPKREQQIPPFVRKTFDILSGREYEEIVCWAEDGNSFIILKPQKFRKIVIPMYFKHNNLSSFIRQLNTYGFHKVNRTKKDEAAVVTGDFKEIMEFRHQYFIRDREELLYDIIRKKPSKVSSSPTYEKSSPELSSHSIKNEKDSTSVPVGSCTGNAASPVGSPIQDYKQQHQATLQPQQQLQQQHQQQPSATNFCSSQPSSSPIIVDNDRVLQLTYHIQYLSTQLKRSQEKVTELENELYSLKQCPFPSSFWGSNGTTNAGSIHPSVSSPSSMSMNQFASNNQFSSSSSRRFYNEILPESFSSHYSSSSSCFPDFHSYSSYQFQDQFAGVSSI